MENAHVGNDAIGGARTTGCDDSAHDNNFTFLRFAAASLVLISHSYPLLGRTDEPFKTFTGYEPGGMIAVAIFFVISGYLVTGSYVNSPGPVSYVRKRCLRLLPALGVVVMVSALLVGPAVSTLSARDYFRQPQTWAYFENCYLNIGYRLPGVFADNPYPHAVNGSLWTLPIEGAMYLLVLALGWRKLLNASVLAVVAGLYGACLAAVGHFDLGDAVWGRLFPVGDSLRLGLFFLSGSLLYVLRRRVLFRASIAFAMVAALLGTVQTPVWPIVFQVALPYLTILAAHADVRWMRRFDRYGDLSYGIYLYAFPVQQLLAHVLGTMPVPTFAALAFAVTLPLAAASWYGVEKPALALKKKLSGEMSDPVSDESSVMRWELPGSTKEQADAAEVRSS